jgi:glycogen debranching enzyme
MANCASGSTRGYDELVPEHISVVEETRTYSKLPTEITLDTGIIQGKRLMNQLHFKMAQFGYSQIYVDQFDNDTTVVTRQNPNTHESYILVARTSFYEPNENTSVEIKP